MPQTDMSTDTHIDMTTGLHRQTDPSSIPLTKSINRKMIIAYTDRQTDMGMRYTDISSAPDRQANVYRVYVHS